ncbi:RING/U-box protein [Tasmannia lanceolata]|uniref:RING/U-box protein n=1 Tax=Tasmannia lanceolata TaxID=3420 RepID=UPI00406360AB
MAGGGKLVCRKDRKRRIRLRDKGSDDSDDDYVLEEEESENSEASLGFPSDESFDFASMSFESDEEDQKVVRSKPKKRVSDWNRSRAKQSRRKIRVSNDDEFISRAKRSRRKARVSDDEEEEEFISRVERAHGKIRVSGDEEEGDDEEFISRVKRSRRKDRVSDEEGDDDDDDEEFVPDADDCINEEEEDRSNRARKQNWARKGVVRKKGSIKSRKRKRKSNGLGKGMRKRGGRLVSKRRVAMSSDEDFDVEDRGVKKKVIKNTKTRKKRTVVNSDSDFVDSESSDFEYTISEEERDLIGESGNSGNLTTCLNKRRGRLVSKRRVAMSSDDDFVVEDRVVKKKVRKNTKRRKKRTVVNLDSEFVDSESSDFEYAISEEERDLIGESGNSGNLTTCLNKRRGRLVSRRRVAMSSDEDFVVEDRVVKKKVRKNTKRRKKRTVVNLDSDFVDSESSDFEYTISEEERDLIRESGNSGNQTNRLRNSSLSKGLGVDGALKHHQQKMLGIKGKEKVINPKLDSGKEVCGICLSEEQKGTIRGTLNCCLHFFCFTCIMEWAKVESRCPLCKQRFVTVSKPARSDVGIGLREAVTRIPKRDQVHQPSEEELRAYLDPYANMPCIECGQLGDDSLMLLCDICDSSAHTYCVGLGREVPEGNWYCEGCRVADPGPSNPLGPDTLPNQSASNSGLGMEHSAGGIDAEGSDIHMSTHSPRPIDSLGQSNSREMNMFVSSTASTVSGRRMLRFRIHRLLSSSRMRPIFEMTNQTGGPPHASLESGIFVSDVDQDMTASQQARTQSGGSPAILGLSPSFTVPNGDPVDARLSYSRKQVIPAPCTASSSRYLEGINPSPTVLDYDQSSGAVAGTSANISLRTQNEECGFSMLEGAKEQVRAMVKSHLKRLSRDTELDRTTFKSIARHSTYTILAACGIKHNRSVTFPIPPPSDCFHLEKGEEPANLLKSCCRSCFKSFVRNVVVQIMKTKLQQ